MKLDAISLLAAKASGELASNVGFLSLTQKCIRNGSHKNVSGPAEKNNDCLHCKHPRTLIFFWVRKGPGRLFSELFPLPCEYQSPWGGTVSLLLTVDFLLSLKIKYKEEYEKMKGKVMGTTDSRLLHSLQVAKMSSEVNSFLSLSPFLRLVLLWVSFRGQLLPGPYGWLLPTNSLMSCGRSLFTFFI